MSNQDGLSAKDSELNPGDTKKKGGSYHFKKNQHENNKKRLIVVLENACLETIKTKNGSHELLNCDDHMGLLKKMGRDWSEVRPDITHQVCTWLLFFIFTPQVFIDASGLSFEQGWSATSLYTYQTQRVDRNQPHDTHPENFQAVFWFNG